MADFKIKIITDASGAVTGSKQTAEALQDVGKEATASGKAMVEADEKAVSKKAQLKEMVKGLQVEFPALASAARLALNPLAFVVAAIAGAFSIWTAKVQGLTDALAGVEMPEITPKKIGEVTAAAEAYNKFAEAVRATVEAYNSVDAASDRALKKISAEAEQKKKLMAADKQLELAKLERDRESLGETEYQKRKLGIEDKYGRFGIAMSVQEKQAEIDEKKRRAAKLRADAEAKAAEAGGIKVATGEQDAATEAEMAARAALAREDQAKVRDRMKDLAAAKSGEGNIMSRMWNAAKSMKRYGYTMTSSEAMALEEQGLANDQNAIDQYDAFMGRKAGRGQARDRRGRLTETAGKEFGEAATLAASLPEEQAALGQQTDADSRANAVESLARAYKASAEVGKQAQELSAQVDQAFATGTRVTMATLAKLEAFQATQAALEARIRALEGKSPTSY